MGQVGNLLVLQEDSSGAVGRAQWCCGESTVVLWWEEHSGAVGPTTNSQLPVSHILVCSQDICCVCSQDICIGSSQDICIVSSEDICIEDICILSHLNVKNYDMRVALFGFHQITLFFGPETWNNGPDTGNPEKLDPL